MGLGPFAPGYVPRLTERSVLHEVVRENLETLLAQARARTEHGFGVPRLLDEEFRAFIRCGVINHGSAVTDSVHSPTHAGTRADHAPCTPAAPVRLGNPRPGEEPQPYATLNM